MIVPNINSHLTLKRHKMFIKVFKNLGFMIDISSNLKILNFLDIILNLSNNIFKPLITEDLTHTYISLHSNHAKSIIEHIPKIVNTRINRLSPNKKFFSASKFIYNQALRNSKFKQELHYHDEPKT